MSKFRKVAVVTGANRGIGLATVKRLCQEFGGDVVLTARDEDRGREAVRLLQQQFGLHPVFHPLDILSNESVLGLKDFLIGQYGGIDILINNAAISFEVEKCGQTEAAETLDTNIEGTLRVYDTLYPILKPHSRVVNVSSRGARLYLKRCSDDNRRLLTQPVTSRQDIRAIINSYKRSLQCGRLEASGWGRLYGSYGFSKLMVILEARLQQTVLDSERGEDGILINSCCPGKVRTQMMARSMKNDPSKTPAEGADSVVYLALLPEGSAEPRGQFVAERKVISLTDD